MRWAAIFLVLWAGSPGYAQKVILGLGEEQVAITARFDGDDVLIFGAIKTQGYEQDDRPLHVIITLSSPPERVVVRRKAKRSMIWINTDSAVIPRAPAFYAVASSTPLEMILDPKQDDRYRVSIDEAVRASVTDAAIHRAEPFIKALVELRKSQDLYQDLPGQVVINEGTLFRTKIALPADLSEGIYRAKIFLIRDNVVIDQTEARIPVRKVGIERILHRMARDQPAFYGILSVAIAIVAGWFASWVFSRLKR